MILVGETTGRETSRMLDTSRRPPSKLERHLDSTEARLAMAPYRTLISLILVSIITHQSAIKPANCAYNTNPQAQVPSSSPVQTTTTSSSTMGRLLPASIEATTSNSLISEPKKNQHSHQQLMEYHLSSSNCSSGLLTFELATGYIYKPSSVETLAMMPSTLQLTDCLSYCLQNGSCLAINFEMGLCVLLSSSAKKNPANLYSSQFPVFTIYAEKKCLLPGDPAASRQRRHCQRAWTFERVAGYEMKTRPRRRLKLESRELCMEACLTEREFECRSGNWYKQTNECTLSDQDRHSVSQSEAGDQQVSKNSLSQLYGPSNLSLPSPLPPPILARPTLSPHAPPGLYENYYLNLADHPAIKQSMSNQSAQLDHYNRLARATFQQWSASPRARKAAEELLRQPGPKQLSPNEWLVSVSDIPANAPVDYLENNCIYEPNKLCEFRKIQNRVLKTVDSIYQEVGSLDECKHKCLTAPYRCYSFDYGDTSDRVCRTSHLDQASLLSVKEPYLDVVGAITYELASCFNVTIQCRAREMVATVSSSKMFRGKIYAKSRPNSCVNDVRESLKFELSMGYHDQACDVRASSTSTQGVFSNDIVIQHHDRIVTTQDVGLSVYCQYDLGNRSVTNNVDLAIERLDDPSQPPMESKNQASWLASPSASNESATSGQSSSPLVITNLATTVVKSPNVTMRITNMNGQPVTSATVGDRLALLFEIKEKTSPFGISVREIIAMDGRQLMSNNSLGTNKLGSYHYGSANGENSLDLMDSAFQASRTNSIQFIDSDGCPTDANIMGPLVKMDSTGQRLLAPFDAFKFPTSDMVFFRAVVGSCVSECKPALCAPTLIGGSSSSEDDLTTRQIATSQPAASTPTAQPSFKPPAIRPSVPSSNRMTTVSQAFTKETTGKPAMQPVASPKTTPASARQTTLSQYSSSMDLNTATSGDSLTTIPGYGQPDPLQTSESTQWTLALEPQRGQIINVTNNHQQGKPVAPKPNIFVAANDRQPSVNLSTLSEDQRRQIVNLFETRLKQPLPVSTAPGSGGISDMADLYTGFLQEIMLKDKSLLQLMPAGQDRQSSRREGEQSRAPPSRAWPENVEDLIASLSADANELQPKANHTLLNDDLLAELSRILGAGQTSGNNDIVPTGSAAGSHTNRMSPPEPAKANSNPPKRKRLYLQTEPRASSSGQLDERARAKRQVESERLVAPAFIRMAQVAGLAAEAPAGGHRFTQAVVELYHTGYDAAPRRKRAIEPMYEMDELVVQSIKIHDRLQFHPNSDQKSPRGARSSLTRAQKSSQQAAHTSADGRLLSAEQLAPRLSIWSSSGALSMLVVAVSFISLQIFLVLMYLIDWNRRKIHKRLEYTRNKHATNPVCFIDQHLPRDSSNLSSFYDASCASLARAPATAHSLVTEPCLSANRGQLYMPTARATTGEWSVDPEAIEQRSMYVQVPRRPTWRPSNQLP